VRVGCPPLLCLLLLLLLLRSFSFFSLQPSTLTSVFSTPTHLPLPPSVYPGGKVCISILHPPGVDATNAQESADERWRPILGVEAVLVSVVAMLADPNIESPANVDAAKMFRDDIKSFKRKVRACVEKSLEG
jgi:ubiquitin-protein ligase